MRKTYTETVEQTWNDGSHRSALNLSKSVGREGRKEVHVTENFILALQRKRRSVSTLIAACGEYVPMGDLVVTEGAAQAVRDRQQPAGADVTCPACEAVIVDALVALRLRERARRKAALKRKAEKAKR